MQEKFDLAAACADLIRDCLMDIHQAHGVPVDALLAGAHAQVTSLMAITWGAEVAAKELRRVADHIEAMPEAKDMALAVADPAGHA